MSNLSSSSFIISKQREVKVSPFNLNYLTLYHDLKSNIVFTLEDLNTTMEISFEKDQSKSNTINLTIKFFVNNKEVHYRYVSKEDLNIFAKSYRTYISTLIVTEKEQQKLFSIEKLKDLKKFIGKLKIILKRKEIINTINRYRNLSSINIVSYCKIDNFKNYNSIARTIIELDADIITIISKDLDTTDKDVSNLLDIHLTNISLGNHIYLYPIKRIFTILQKVKDNAIIFGAPVVSNISFLPLHDSFISNPYNIEIICGLFSLFYVSLSTGIIKLLPKVIKHLIKL
jgi:hypothetical protein